MGEFTSLAANPVNMDDVRSALVTGAFRTEPGRLQGNVTLSNVRVTLYENDDWAIEFHPGVPQQERDTAENTVEGSRNNKPPLYSGDMGARPPESYP